MKITRQSTSHIPLYPTRFMPIYQYRIWGGRNLTDLLSAPLSGDGPIGVTWVLSDRDDHANLVADGSLKGQTINQLMENKQEHLLGKLAGYFKRFPLLLRFLNITEKLENDGVAKFIQSFDKMIEALKKKSSA